jgi:glycosyltransferase involved in cell wall biosynthesis
MLARYFPETRGRVDVIAHAMLDEPLASTRTTEARPVTAVLLPADDVPTVAVVGAIGRDKGARRIERLAQRVKDRGARVRLVVIGYLDVQHGPWQSSDAALTVHGRYSRLELPALFAHYRVAFVMYPSEGPESFSYTLSEAWRAGVPALVPPIGALAERVAESRAGWVMTNDEWSDDDRMLDRVLALLSEAATEDREAAAANARAAPHTAPRAMAEATLVHYARAAPKGRRANIAPAFPNLRIRDALGYRPWTQPANPDAVIETPALHAMGGVWQRIARRALAIRRTPMGRLLYRMTPEPLIDALKARLRD